MSIREQIFKSFLNYFFNESRIILFEFLLYIIYKKKLIKRDKNILYL